MRVPDCRLVGCVQVSLNKDFFLDFGGARVHENFEIFYQLQLS
jgi:hypothetical protein